MGRLERKSLSQQMATVLEDDIRSGVWRVALPGYRVLQEYYSVSKVICERALALLEMKGLLAAAEPRKRRGILLKTTTKGMPSLGTLLMVSDISHQRILIPWKQSSAMLRPTVIRVFKQIYGDLLSDRQIEEAVPVRDFQSPDDWLPRGFLPIPIELIGGDSVAGLTGP